MLYIVQSFTKKILLLYVPLASIHTQYIHLLQEQEF